MTRSKTGWSQGDLKTLYEGYGFKWKDGAKHAVVTHPDYPGELRLRTTIARTRVLPIGYISKALKMLDVLEELQEDGKNEDL